MPYRIISLVLAGVFSLPFSAQCAQPLTTDETLVREFIATMESRHGFKPDETKAMLRQAQIVDKIIKAISRPAEAKPWHVYRKIFVTPSRIEKGVAFWRKHEATLKRAADKFGVDPAVIVAIIGVETFYGQHRGRHRVLDSLATLGFRYRPRGRFFRGELEHFLLMIREEGLDGTALRGSYAGAMGIPQFISSSYREYAVDFDGDGARDLLGSVADAIGSVANYLSRHGWRKHQAVAVKVKVSGDGYRALLSKKPRRPRPDRSLAELSAGGVTADGIDASAGAKGALLEFDLAGGKEYWLGFQNFYTITRYNHSPLYALAVFQLSEAIRSKKD